MNSIIFYTLLTYLSPEDISMEKFIVSKNRLYGDERKVEKLVSDVIDEDTGEELQYESI